MLETAILIVMVIVALAIIGLILVQQGKGADMGASFGSGASNTVFGSQGSGNFLTRTTAALATVFFICCLVLAWFANHKDGTASGIDFSAPPVELKEIPGAVDVPNVTPAQPESSDVPAAASSAATPAVAPAGAVPEKAAAAPVVAVPVAEPTEQPAGESTGEQKTQ